MKKLIFSLAALAMGFAASAQISQGSIMIGGNLGFTSTGAGKETSSVGGVSMSKDRTAISEWNFTPSVGYFLTDALAAGVRLNFASSNVKQVSSADFSKTENVNAMDIGIGVFGRYYKSLGSNFYLYGDLGINYMTGSYTDKKEDPNDVTKIIDADKISMSGFGVTLTPGVAYFPAENWAVDFNLNNILNYSSTTVTEEAPNNGGKVETTDSDFGVGLGLTPTLGVHYFFGK